MQKENFQKYLYKPEVYDDSIPEELEELVKQFPWFSTGAIILLFLSKMKSESDYNENLKKYILNIPNRSYTKRILQSGIYKTLKANDRHKAVEGSTDLHSRIPGILNQVDNTETNKISVLEDDSLLEFTASLKADINVPPESINGDQGLVDQESPDDTLELDATEIPDTQNFDHWIEKFGGDSVIEKSPLKKHGIIESFINSDPGVIRADKEVRLKGDVSRNSTEEHEGFITDTLAKIYLKQGLYNKAIYAYEKLCLKYPEKSIYFASQIEEIKSLYIKK